MYIQLLAHKQLLWPIVKTAVHQHAYHIKQQYYNYINLTLGPVCTDTFFHIF